MGYVGFGVLIALIVGWIANIVQICQAATVTGMVVGKAVAIFIPPLGSILGLVGLF